MSTRTADGAAELAFAEQVAASVPCIARGLVELGPEDLGAGSLVLPLSVSLWLRRAGADLPGGGATLALRAALLQAAGMDVASEPVPLLAGDDRTIVLHLAVYLLGLLDRAVSACGDDADAVVDRALSLLERGTAATGH